MDSKHGNVKSHAPAPGTPTEEVYQQNGWTFLVRKSIIFGNKENESLENAVKFQHLPDAFFGKNLAQMQCPERNFVYDFNPFDALLLTKYDIRKDMFKEGYGKTNLVNLISFIPSEVKIKAAEKWKDYKTPEDTEIKTLEVIGDWTCSTPYKGTIRTFSGLPKPDAAMSPEETVKASVLTKEQPEFVLEETAEDIPLHRLGPDNPILNYNEVTFYEDDLGDCGYSMAFLRYRSMKDCWFALFRCYIRCDDVLIRILDTRIFHEYGKDYLLREFSVRESPVEELTKMGLKINAEFILDQKQSDIAYRFLKVLKTVKEKVTFKGK